MKITSKLQNEIKLPSNKMFGYFFSLIFLVFAIYLYMNEYYISALIVFIMLLLLMIITIIRPIILEPLNRLWTNIGLLLGQIFNPIILGVIFFIIFTPLSVIMRLLGRDALMVKRNDRSSFWKKRDITEFSPSSFENQY